LRFTLKFEEFLVIRWIVLPQTDTKRLWANIPSHSITFNFDTLKKNTIDNNKSNKNASI